MSLEHKPITLKRLQDSGEGAALFSVWSTPDHDGDVTRKGFFGDGVQEVFMIPAHAHQSEGPPLAKGIIYERGEGAVYEFQMNLELEAARAWHSHLKFDLSQGREPQQQWSYAFRLRPGSTTPITHKDGTKGRELHAAADGGPGGIVIEVSPVLAASQPLGRTLGAKDDDQLDALQAVILKQRELISLLKFQLSDRAGQEERQRDRYLYRDAMAKLTKVDRLLASRRPRFLP